MRIAFYQRAMGGKRLQIECGSLYDWLGAPVPVAPDIGLGFDVRPEGELREVEWARRDYALIRTLLNRGACKLDLPLDMESPLSLEAPTDFTVELARVVTVQIRAGVREGWRELRGIERALDEMTEAFGGEDVLQPRIRRTFDEAKTILTDLHERLQQYTGPFELPDQDEEVDALVKKIVEREIASM